MLFAKVELHCDREVQLVEFFRSFAKYGFWNLVKKFITVVLFFPERRWKAILRYSLLTDVTRSTKLAEKYLTMSFRLARAIPQSMSRTHLEISRLEMFIYEILLLEIIHLCIHRCLLVGMLLRLSVIEKSPISSKEFFFVPLVVPNRVCGVFGRTVE